MWWWIILLTGLTLLLIFHKILGRDDRKLPPLRDGWLPYLGCAFEMGKEPLKFINRTRKELGDVFTIHVAGKHMTFVFGQSSLQYVFSSSHLSFKETVLPFVMKTAGISKESFHAHYVFNNVSLKEGLSPSKLVTMCEELSTKLHHEMDNMVTGEMDLMEFTRTIMVPAAVKHLFGDNLLPDEREAALEFQRNLMKFDEDFERGIELPSIFMKEWTKSKLWLREKLDHYVSKLSDLSTPFQKILGKVERASAPGNGLLLLFGSQTNALVVVFWCLCHILSNHVLFEEVKQEAKNVFPSADQLGHTPITHHMIQQLSTIKRCVLEALRLCTPGVVTRKVIKTHTFKGYTIPKGHYISFSPFLENRNPELFPDPDRFDPDRWKSCDLNNFQFLDGFVGFSGGFHQCPGRYFAMTEMFMIVPMVINKFDLKLTTEVPQMSYSDLVGTQKPSQPCKVMITKRK